MSMLESLPVELFRETASYLTFLDKKALSVASKRCNAMTGSCECPDRLTWLIHLCRCPTKLHGPVLENPKLFKDLIFSLNLSCTNGRLIPSKAEIEDLVSPYFPKIFPESTLVYHYMTVARDFVKSTIPISDTARLPTATLTPRYYWGRIESEAAYIIGWLERQKPTERPCCNTSSRLDSSLVDTADRH